MRIAELNIGEIHFHNQAFARGGTIEGWLSEAVAKLAVWRERVRQREVLACMDQFALRDIGATRADVWRELRKAPWEA